MAAVIRNACRKDDPGGWTDEELLDSFALIAEPKMGYADWAASPLVAGEPVEDDTLQKIEASGLVEKGILTIE
jgi:hypothetical protein